jgi:hypothetical protein
MNKDVLFLKNNHDMAVLMNEFQEYLSDVENHYFLDYHGYLYKLYHDIPIGNYDLWNEGNYGYKGIEKKIKELDIMCKDKECLFIVNKDLGLSKTSQLYKICNYVVENYLFVEEIPEAYVYSNRFHINFGVDENTDLE